MIKCAFFILLIVVTCITFLNSTLVSWKTLNSTSICSGLIDDIGLNYKSSFIKSFCASSGPISFFIYRCMELEYSSMSRILWTASVRNRRSSWVWSPLWKKRSYQTALSTPTSASAYCPAGLSLSRSRNSSCSFTSCQPMESTLCPLRSTNRFLLQL